MRKYTVREIELIKSVYGIPPECSEIIYEENSVVFYSGSGNLRFKLSERDVNKVIENEKLKLVGEILRLARDKNIEILRVPIDEMELVETSRNEPERFHSLLLRYRPIESSDIYRNQEPLDILEYLYKLIDSSSYNSTILWPTLTEDYKRRVETKPIPPNIDKTILLPSNPEFYRTQEFCVRNAIVIPPVREFGVPISGKAIRKKSEIILSSDSSQIEEHIRHLDKLYKELKEEDFKYEKRLTADEEVEEE
jgi:hypothetical protein